MIGPRLGCFASLLLASFAGVAAGADAGWRPNVVVIIADDMGWGDLSRNGNSNLATPHLDRLASQGASFDRFYVQPVCAPTRAEFLTGRCAHRTGVVGVSEGRERLDPSARTIADAFQTAGYATAAFGKWHNGTQAPYHPLCRGFDEFYGFTSGHWGHYYDFWLDHNGRLVKGAGYAANDFAEHAAAFVCANRTQPFFVLLAFNTPHSPMQAPDEWWAKHRRNTPRLRGTDADREDLAHTRAALAMCENLDANVGLLLQTLDDQRLADDTIVVFFSDNGPNGHRWNGGMQGIKGSTDEGGVRSPLLVRWPGEIPARVTLGEPAAAIDLAPTLASLAGIPLDGFDPLDGVDLSASLRDPSTPPRPERTLFTTWNGRTAARRGRWLLGVDGTLFDLAVTPQQAVELVGNHSAVHQQLQQERERWLSSAPAPSSLLPLDVGHRALPLTQLPARDAKPAGNLRRSNRYPNCSYLTGWRAPADRAVWDVHVHESADYQATVYLGYAADTPTRSFVLRCGPSSLAFETPLHTVQPVLGEPRDLTPRQESDVRDFQPVEAGSLELQAGRQMIELGLEGPINGPTPDLWLLTLKQTD